MSPEASARLVVSLGSSLRGWAAGPENLCLACFRYARQAKSRTAVIMKRAIVSGDHDAGGAVICDSIGVQTLPRH
jgi:hypothetical protein